MRALLAIAELRLRGAVAARIPWIVPAAFAAGVAIAAWAPGAGPAARARAADEIALGAAAVAAVLAVLVLAATAFAGEVRTGAAHSILTTSASRASVVAGGALGHATFGALILVAAGGAAALGLDAGGLGARVRAPIRPYEAAQVVTESADGVATLAAKSAPVRATFVAPDGLEPGEPLHVRLSPRSQVLSEWSPSGAVTLTAGAPGRPGPAVRVGYKAGVAFEADVPSDEIVPGAPCEIVIAHADGGRLLRFRPGDVEVGGARTRFTWNLVAATLCMAPFLALAACTGAAASARLGAAASTALVLSLVLVVAGRGVIEDGARFVIDTAREQETDPHAGHDHDHDHDHDHRVEVTAAQVALARVALAGLRAVPDASDFWRFDGIAAGRATTPADAGRAMMRGVLPCAVLLASAWLLLRRREILPE